MGAQPAAMQMGAAPPMPAPPPPMGMPPMGGPPMGMPMDPMAAVMQDPLVLAELIRLITEEIEQENGPVYPRWYKPERYPKPKMEQWEAKARKDQSLHQLLVKRILAEREILALRTVGQFPDAEEDSEMTFSDPSMVHDFNLAASTVAGCEVSFSAKARTLDEADLVEKKQLAAFSFRDRWKRRNQAMYGTDLQYDEAKIAMGTGRLVARFSLDFDAERDQFPVKADLLDPTTCFPTWEGDRGLANMTRVYSQTVDQIVATFDDGSRNLRKKLLDATVKTETGAERQRTMDDQVEVIEYWDRRWYAVSAAGIEVIVAEHRYGFVPFVYVMSPYGDAGPQSLHSMKPLVSGPSGTVQLDIASKGLSHIWATWKAHEQREAILGRLFTELKKTGNPPRIFAQDLSVYGEAPEVGDQEGGIYMIRRGLEEEVPGPQKPGFSLIGPIMGAVNEAAARGYMPASAYGLTSNANESGTAIESLNESGRDKITPWLTMLQRWDAECAMMALSLFRDWGHLLGTDGERGEFEIEMRQVSEDGEGTFIISPADIRKVGVKLEAKRTSLRLASLGRLGNDLATWKANGWLLDEEALEMRGVENPREYLRQVEIQEMKKDPEYRKLAIVKMMEEEGDFVGAMMYRQMIMSQGGMQQGGQPPQQGGPQPMDPTLPGGPGTRGGAPPGSGMGPQTAQPMTGSLGMPSRMAGPPPMPGGIQ